MAPHSLGKLIEWKHNDFTCVRIVIVIKTPHSLGKLIEWKNADSLYGGSPGFFSTVVYTTPCFLIFVSKGRLCQFQALGWEI